MSQRPFSLKANSTITACLKCGNNTEFTGHSDYCAEDCCNVWVVCKCGYDPTEYRSDYRLEDVWGGLSENLLLGALCCWNDAIKEAP